jgi:hypothetical protein
MSEWISHENIGVLGKGVEKLNFSTAKVEERIE